jgi:hypothetical protein
MPVAPVWNSDQSIVRELAATLPAKGFSLFVMCQKQLAIISGNIVVFRRRNAV